MSEPCRAGDHRRCYPMGKPEHVFCDCPCHEDWD